MDIIPLHYSNHDKNERKKKAVVMNERLKERSYSYALVPMRNL